MVFPPRLSIRDNDGVLTEHGDGFTLSLREPEELDQPALTCRAVAVADEFDVLVVGGEDLLSGRLLIGWRRWKYTCEPPDDA